MATEHSLSYRATGVVDNTQLGLSALLKWVNASAAFRSTGAGRRVVDVGYFASVVQITDTLGLALCTDGVGSKVLVAEMLGRYDTIGIDCVAMNVNDAICVGAEPISFLDYIAIERATPEVLAGPAPYRLAPEGRRQPRIDRGPRHDVADEENRHAGHRLLRCRQFVEQSLRLPEVGGVEPLRKPAVGIGEQSSRFVSLPLPGE
jgi:hypothetical protein